MKTIDYFYYFIFIAYIFIVIFMNIILIKYLNRSKENSCKKLFTHSIFINSIKLPLILASIVYTTYVAILLVTYTFSIAIKSSLKHLMNYQLKLISIFILLIFIYNILIAINQKLTNLARTTSNTLVKIFLPIIKIILYSSSFLILLNILYLPILSNWIQEDTLTKFNKLFLITILGWVFIHTINIFEYIIMSRYVIRQENDLMARKLKTQIIILKRTLIISVGIIVFSTCLLVFDSFKNIGAGLLTTAGVLSAIGAFASQQSLSRIFSGIQIAFTQPVRIGDSVIINNEFGQVEEITLSYVIIKLWDFRRLILPTDHLMKESIINLTRTSTQLLGAVIFYMDYTLPVSVIRKKLLYYLKKTPLWDGRIAVFVINDTKEFTMEVRAIVSAENAEKLNDLRCYVRERLISYIVKKHPQCLPKYRYILANMHAPRTEEH